MRLIAGLAAALILVGLTSAAQAKEIEIPGAPCNPPPARCADAKCAAAVTEPGNVVEPVTGRKFFLDYACGLKKGDKALFLLNVHGIGGNANWQRHYFPAVDFKDKYKLIIATGKSTGINFQAAPDDAYVLGMIDYVAKAFPGVDIRFWVVGHSAGGGYSRSFMCRDTALRSKLMGSVSLAGNRVGGAGSGFPPEFGAFMDRSGLGGRTGGPPPGAPPTGGRGPGVGPTAAPSCGQFSHIYSTGDQDSLGGNPVPATSTLANALGCGPRVRLKDIVDRQGGRVYDARDREAPLPGWGKEARPGTTEVFEFSRCPGHRVVADFVRLGKGHTEGLEPKVTEAIIRKMVEASR